MSLRKMVAWIPFHRTSVSKIDWNEQKEVKRTKNILWMLKHTQSPNFMPQMWSVILAQNKRRRIGATFPIQMEQQALLEGKTLGQTEKCNDSSQFEGNALESIAKPWDRYKPSPLEFIFSTMDLHPSSSPIQELVLPAKTSLPHTRVPMGKKTKQTKNLGEVEARKMKK